MIYGLKTLRDSKINTATDHGKSSKVSLAPLLAESSIERIVLNFVQQLNPTGKLALLLGHSENKSVM